jgi:6-pyruvoyl-tetrahydropterin synthase
VRRDGKKGEGGTNHGHAFGVDVGTEAEDDEAGFFGELGS